MRFVALDPATHDSHEPPGYAFPLGEYGIFRRRVTLLFHATESNRAGLGQCSGITPGGAAYSGSSSLRRHQRKPAHAATNTARGMSIHHDPPQPQTTWVCTSHSPTSTMKTRAAPM